MGEDTDTSIRVFFLTDTWQTMQSTVVMMNL